MSDLISREDIPYIDLNGDMPQSKVRVWVAFKEQIDALPSADTDMSDYCDRLWKIAYERGKADRPTGEWINREKCQVDEDAYEVATCSECGAEITIEYPHDSYCPNCGAKMRGEDSE